MDELERLLVWMIIRAGALKLHTVFSNPNRTGLDAWKALDLKYALSGANAQQHKKYGYTTGVWKTVLTVEDNGWPRVQSAIGDVLV